jgi:hypothetical protein
MYDAITLSGFPSHISPIALTFPMGRVCCLRFLLTLATSERVCRGACGRGGGACGWGGAEAGADGEGLWGRGEAAGAAGCGEAAGGVVEVAEGFVAEVRAAAAASVGKDVLAGIGDFGRFHGVLPPGVLKGTKIRKTKGKVHPEVRRRVPPRSGVRSAMKRDCEAECAEACPGS